jgi:hypothetical protein
MHCDWMSLAPSPCWDVSLPACRYLCDASCTAIPDPGVMPPEVHEQHLIGRVCCRAKQRTYTPSNMPRHTCMPFHMSGLHSHRRMHCPGMGCLLLCCQPCMPRLRIQRCSASVPAAPADAALFCSWTPFTIGALSLCSHPAVRQGHYSLPGWLGRHRPLPTPLSPPSYPSTSASMPYAVCTATLGASSS